VSKIGGDVFQTSPLRTSVIAYRVHCTVIALVSPVVIASFALLDGQNETCRKPGERERERERERRRATMWSRYSLDRCHPSLRQHRRLSQQSRVYIVCAVCTRVDISSSPLYVVSDFVNISGSLEAMGVIIIRNLHRHHHNRLVNRREESLKYRTCHRGNSATGNNYRVYTCRRDIRA